MQDYGFTVGRGLVIIGIWALLTAGCALVFEREDWLPGLLLGYIASTFYYLSLLRQIGRGAAMSCEQAVLYMRGGLLARLALVTVTVILAIRFFKVEILAVLVGASSFPLIVLVNTCALITKEFREED